MDVSVFDNTIVIDNGTGTIKAGLARDSLPSIAIPSVVGTPKHNLLTDSTLRDSYVGDEAQSKRGILTLKYPIEHGIVTNWDDMEKIWHHIFHKEMHMDSSEHRIMMTDAPQICAEARCKMAEVMFETFSTPSMYIGNEASLSLSTSGSTTGLVLHSGFSHTYVVPVYEGYALQHLLSDSKFGGETVTDYLIKRLSERGFPILTTTRSSPERAFLDRIKHDMTFLTSEQNSTCSVPKEKKYFLPDNSTIVVRNEIYECPELMFKSSPDVELGVEESIHLMVLKILEKCDSDILKIVASNIILSGGNTLFLGFAKRLQKELTTLAKTEVASCIRVVSPENRDVSSWIGGALVSSLPSFDRCSMFIKKEEYVEYGPDVVARKWPI